MSRCVKTRRRKSKVCLGEMNSQVVLVSRAITAPAFGDAEFGETFSDTSTVWACVNTVTGKTYFDGVNVDRVITHNVDIRYDSTVTAETWVKLDDNRQLDVLRVEDLDERHDFMRLVCSERGASTLPGAQT